MPDLVPVRVRDCACPDSPHAEEGDIVYLAPRLSTPGGIAATTELQEAGEDVAGLTARLFVTFIRYGVQGANWSPFDVQELIDDYALGEPVAEKANDLYMEAFTRPLRTSLPESSNSGRTAGSTSRTRRSTRKLVA